MSLVTRVRSRSVHTLRPIVVAGLLAVAPAAVAAPQSWGALIGTEGGESVYGIAPDGFGGTFECGSTLGDLGGPQLALGDAFVTRRDATGGVAWSRKIATLNIDEGRGVAPDGLGGVFLAGNRNGVVDAQFATNFDAFVARFDAAGVLLWQRAVGSADYEELVSCAPDGSGGVFVAGRNFANAAAAALNNGDIWLAHFDAGGAVLWTREFGSSADDRCLRVESDGGGGALLCGLTFGDLGGPLQGSPDAWYARYDGAGNQQWVRQLGNSVSLAGPVPFPPTTFASGLASDGAGGFFLTGGSFALLAPGASVRDQAFVGRFDGQGNTLWLDQFGLTGTESAVDAVSDAQGGVYVAGTTYGAFEATSAGASDLWVRHLDGSGQVLQALQFGAKNPEFLAEIALVGGGLVACGDSTGFQSMFGTPVQPENGWIARYESCELDSEFTYCTAVAGSTGWPSGIGSSGSANVSNNDFGLFANFIPDQETGVFLMASAPGGTPFGNGTLCVGGTVLRLSVDLPVFGVAETSLDMTDPNSPASLITSGSTWYFQFWYRDTAGGGAGFNLSNGLSITFCP